MALESAEVGFCILNTDVVPLPTCVQSYFIMNFSDY